MVTLMRDLAGLISSKWCVEQANSHNRQAVHLSRLTSRNLFILPPSSVAYIRFSMSQNNLPYISFQENFNKSIVQNVSQRADIAKIIVITNSYEMFRVKVRSF